MRAFPMALIATALLASGVSAAELAAIVQKPTIDVYAQPKLDSPKITTLKRDTAVKISAQQGLWYELQMPAGTPGYVRVNDVRIDYAGVEDGDANLRVLMGGKAGEGRVTETAGVRGIDESDLKSAAFDQAQLTAMVGYRVDDSAAAAHAGEQGWQATSVAYAGEAKPGKSTGKSPSEAPAQQSTAQAASSVLGSLGHDLGSLFGKTSNQKGSFRRRNSHSARLSPAASSARAHCGTMPLHNSASMWSDAGSPRKPAGPSCRGPLA